MVAKSSMALIRTGRALLTLVMLKTNKQLIQKALVGTAKLLRAHARLIKANKGVTSEALLMDHHATRGRLPQALTRLRHFFSLLQKAAASPPEADSPHRQLTDVSPKASGRRQSCSRLAESSPRCLPAGSGEEPAVAAVRPAEGGLRPADAGQSDGV